MTEDYYNIFPSMSGLLNEIEYSRFKIEKYKISNQKARILLLRDLINNRNEYEGIVPEKDYVALIDKAKKEVVMSDTPMEKRTNYDFYKKAYGDILIGGLGIGMIILAIQDKPEVNKIVVVEKYKEIIDIIQSQLKFNNKVKIINNDIFRWNSSDFFDCIYFDIWNCITRDYYNEHEILYNKYMNNLKTKPNSWIGSWRTNDFIKI